MAQAGYQALRHQALLSAQLRQYHQRLTMSGGIAQLVSRIFIMTTAIHRSGLRLLWGHLAPMGQTGLMVQPFIRKTFKAKTTRCN
jgi:hypothetical protein